jgi:hypothetical protein
MLTRSYLRASTDEQDASRARTSVEAFASDHGLTIVGTYVENESGAKLARPELFRLIADSWPGDVLLIEQVDRDASLRHVMDSNSGGHGLQPGDNRQGGEARRLGSVEGHEGQNAHGDDRRHRHRVAGGD